MVASEKNSHGTPLSAFDEDPQADWYARADETKDGLIDLYRRVGAFA